MRRSWRISAVCLFAVILASLPALAEHTRFWRTTNYSDFERGTAKGVALWSDGKLVPAAEFGHFADPNLAYLWALRADSKGQLYASGGSNARVFRFDKQGHPTTVFQSSELTAQAIAFDAHDDLFVGTSPDGKVYKVTPKGQSSVFFDPKTKYIWSLAVDRDGVLYVGTGDKGEIYAVTPAGKSELFYKSDERHIRALALDGKGNLIAGTDPSGLVIRIPIDRGAAAEPPKAGAAFVIYETAGQEITALDFGHDGNLYVASIGAKHGQASATISAPTGTTFVFSAAPGGAAAGEQAAAAAAAAAAQGTPVTFGAPQYVTVTGFAVGTVNWDRGPRQADVEGVVRAIDRTAQPNPAWSGESPDPATSYAPYRIYNIGNNRKERLMRYIQVLEDCLGKKAEKNFLPMQPGDVPATYADCGDLVKDFDYKLETAIENGLAAFVRWYNDYYGV